MNNDGGHAFPTTPQCNGYPPDVAGNGTGCGPGMSLRDYFAAAAMQGSLGFKDDGEVTLDDYARDAYRMAEAMLAAREEQP